MLNFNRNLLIKTAVQNYNETLEKMLDTERYVPEDIREEYINFIKESLKSTFDSIKKEDKIFQKKYKKALKKVRKKIHKNMIEDIISFYLNKEEYEPYEQEDAEENVEENIENET